ncbi:MAG: mannose-6-phosphate isomerase, class I [Flavisolibacter sp.]
MPNIFKIKGKVQHYAWGGFDYIPQMLAVENDEKKPFGEYWLGAHPQAPSLLENGHSLSEEIAKNEEEFLGKNSAAKYHRLPFLFKVLDVREMLSIQLHPSKKVAEKGFAKENDLGVPLTASHRNYKDDNHKPELMVALSDFWLLHGFKSPDLLEETLSSIPEFSQLLQAFSSGSYSALYRQVMEMPQAEVNKTLSPLLQRIIPAYRKKELKKSDPNFWAARAAEIFCSEENIDRGIFSIYLLNLLQLKKGEGIFQPAGVLHAYLEGQNVELMANSDNVIRGGLTPKHIDIEELLANVVTEPVVPQVIHAEQDGCYQTPAEEFRLCHQTIKSSTLYQPQSALLVFCFTGACELIEKGKQAVVLHKGEAAFVKANTGFMIESEQGVEIFSAFTP